MRRIATLSLVSLVLTSGAFAKSKILATVGKKPVTETQINHFIATLPSKYQAQKLDPKFRKSVLDFLINQEIMLKEARKKRIDKDPKVLMQIDQARKQIIGNALLLKYLKGKTFNVSDSEIKAFYDSYKISHPHVMLAPLAKVKPFIKQRLIAEKKTKAVKAYIDFLRKKYNVKVNVK